MNEETKKKISNALKGKKTGRIPKSAFKKGQISPFKGHKHTQEAIEKNRLAHLQNKDINNKRYHHNNNFKYKCWRIKVFERDNWTCQTCGARSGVDKVVYLNAHHIKSWAKYPRLRYYLMNGITLCKECHKLIHKISNK
jgi:5-methylcytosine-specific restriction endonuclease McrA